MGIKDCNVAVLPEYVVDRIQALTPISQDIQIFSLGDAQGLVSGLESRLPGSVAGPPDADPKVRLSRYPKPNAQNLPSPCDCFAPGSPR